MKVWVLGSGSKGNAVLLESRATRVLVDCGFGTRTIAQRLKSAGVAPQEIDACVLTHDHSDHVSGVAAAAAKWGWKVYATAGTAGATCLADVPVTTFAAGETLRLGRFEVETAATPHDASEPVGLVLTDVATGARAGICYDVGHASDAVRALCREVDVLVLEANHDEGMLWSGPYPPWLCQRIAGGNGHLSNKAAGELARDSVSKRLAHIVLAHLSEKNNSPAIAHGAVSRALSRTRWRGTLTPAAQHAVVGPFAPLGTVIAQQAQLSLGL